MTLTTNIIEIGSVKDMNRIIELGDFCVGDSYCADLIGGLRHKKYTTVYYFSSCTVTRDLHNNRDL